MHHRIKPKYEVPRKSSGGTIGVLKWSQTDNQQYARTWVFWRVLDVWKYDEYWIFVQCIKCPEAIKDEYLYTVSYCFLHLELLGPLQNVNLVYVWEEGLSCLQLCVCVGTSCPFMAWIDNGFTGKLPRKRSRHWECWVVGYVYVYCICLSVDKSQRS